MAPEKHLDGLRRCNGGSTAEVSRKRRYGKRPRRARAHRLALLIPMVLSRLVFPQRANYRIFRSFRALARLRSAGNGTASRARLEEAFGPKDSTTSVRLLPLCFFPPQFFCVLSISEHFLKSAIAFAMVLAFLARCLSDSSCKARDLAVSSSES
jgi:hypothetical protein